MSDTTPIIPLPLPAGQVLDMSFLENRARLLEMAAFLDRIDRACDSDAGRADFRYRSLIHGIRLLLDSSTAGRTRAIQFSFSDPTTAPIADATGLKAHGAWNGDGNEGH